MENIEPNNPIYGIIISHAENIDDELVIIPDKIYFRTIDKVGFKLVGSKILYEYSLNQEKRKLLITSIPDEFVYTYKYIPPNI
jgi:hypothetical protein